MQPHDPNRSFLDKNTLLAFALISLFFVGWQYYMSKNAPKVAPQKVEAAKEVLDQKAANPTQIAAAPSEATAQVFEEKPVNITTNKYLYEITNYGMGIKNAVIKDYTDRKDQPLKIGDSSMKTPFATFLIGKAVPVVFQMEQKSPLEIVGTAEVDGFKIVKTMTFDPELYSFKVDTYISSLSGQAIPGYQIFLADNLVEYPSSFLAPQYEHQDTLIFTDGSEKRHVLNATESESESFKMAKIVSLSTPYFTQALIDKSQTLPEAGYQTMAEKKWALTEINYKPAGNTADFQTSFIGIVGPKSIDVLKQIDPEASRIIDLGFFSAIGKPLLALMKWFQKYLGNWGLAIIALTLLVRLIVMPFNISSYRSMKNMQKVQEPMKRLRERYADDPQKLNLEMMALMKKEKVNPLGGCLPMLLQLPIFFALYQVFAKSIELYKQPFMLWIQDLSIKDPYFILPVLMGITMFVQQWITPTTVDANQRRILMIMPVVFSLFMISLPSGLTLYIFVSTLFGIIQQKLFMRDKTAVVARA